MKAATGFFMLALIQAAASCFAASADLTDEQHALGVRSALKLEHVDEVQPTHGIATDAHAGRLSDAKGSQLANGLVGQGAGFRQDANVTSLVDVPGMIPILHSSGVMTPGQFGPMSRTGRPSNSRRVRTMSRTGIPSVMQMTSRQPASTASAIASAAPAAGTKIQEVSAPSAVTASSTESKIGDLFVEALPSAPGSYTGDNLGAVRHQARAWICPDSPVMP